MIAAAAGVIVIKRAAKAHARQDHVLHGNRAWSASADGYADEVLEYIDKAFDPFHHAQQRLAAVQAEPG